MTDLPNRTTPTYDALVAPGGINVSPGLTMAKRHRNWQAVAATSGTDTTPASGTQFVTSVFLPANFTATGIGYLIGTVGGTDKVYAVLYDSTGAVVANSALTDGGATVGTAANAQELAFTSTVSIKGPALYYIGISMNGDTARLRTVPAHTQGGVLGGQVSQTHGTVAAITVPATFTADKAPVAYVY
jgi:hypothetical protein